MNSVKLVGELWGQITTLTSEWDFLTGVDVKDEHRQAAVVVVGDSITDGLGSTSDGNRRWTDFLAKRLQGRAGFDNVAVANEGITGNRLLHPGADGLDFFGPAALARFDRDVLGQAGAKYLLVLLGINDFAQPAIVAPSSDEVTAEEVVAGHPQLIARAHEKGIAVYAVRFCCLRARSLLPDSIRRKKKPSDRSSTNG